MNTGFNIGGQSYKFATSAENVKYGSGTVKDALDDIKSFDTSGMSEFGKKLYAADEKEFYRLLGISKTAIFDEHQNLFTSSYPGAYLVDSQPRTDASQWSLRLYEAAFWSAAPIEFGGAPFTITFYMKATSTASTSYFRALGTKRSFGMWNNDAKYWSLYYGTTSIPTWCGNSTSSWASGWQLVKFSYNGTTLSLVANGITYSLSATISVPREPRRLIFGSCTGFFDEFKLIDDGTEKVHLAFE